jgi:hypothetical protein
MIFLNMRVIFVHVPRTGGTSLNWLFRESVGKHAIKKIKSYEPFDVRWYGGDWRYMIGHMNFPSPESLPKDVVVLTILRNPVDRILSWFKYLEVTRKEVKGGVDPAKRKSPREYRDMLCRFANMEQNKNQQARIIAGIFQGVLKCNFAIEHVDAAMLVDCALSNIQKSRAIVGTTENYSTYLEMLCRKFSLSPPSAPKRRGDTSHIEVDLDEEARELILASNQADYEIWRAFSETSLVVDDGDSCQSLVMSGS